MKLGVTADLHGNLRLAKKFASYFKKSDVDAVVIAGDLPAYENQKLSLTKILQIFSKCGKRVFVMPGSHESVKIYEVVLKKFKKKIVDCTKEKNRKVQIGDYDIVFLPGSDWLGAEDAGFILRDSRKIFRGKTQRQIAKYYSTRKVKLFYIHELKKLVKNPAKTVLISHIPPKFNKKSAIDVAKFGKAVGKFKIKAADKEATKGLMKFWQGFYKEHVFALSEALKLKKKGYPMTIIQENRGNKVLKMMIKKLKIKKLVCAHIHESGGHANDLKGKPVTPDKWSKELFYNCSGRAGIVEFEGNLSRYRNIKV
jgi:Icc-related predicted phosphoesterase